MSFKEVYPEIESVKAFIREKLLKQNPYSYLIYKDEDGIYKAKNGHTNKIDFSGTDASAVIQSAINNLDKGRIIIARGDYVVGDIDITAPVHISGESMFATRLIPKDGARYIFRILQHNVVISDMELDGLRKSLFGIRHFWGDSDRLYGLFVERLYMHDFFDYEAWFTDNIFDISIDKVIITRGTAGLLHILDAADVRINSSIFYGYFAQPFLCKFEGCANLGIINSLLDTCGAGTNKAIWLRAGRRNKVINCHFISNGIDIYLEDETYDKVAFCHEELTDTYFLQETGACDNNIVCYNTLETPKPIIKIGANTIIKHNRGYATENSGTATITAGNTYVDVTHGLAITPDINMIKVTPKDNLGGRSFWVSDVTSTTFRINISSADTVDHSFGWSYE